MIELLQATWVRLGLVTNGEQWMLVTELPDETGHGFLPTGLIYFGVSTLSPRFWRWERGRKNGAHHQHPTNVTATRHQHQL